MATVRGHVPMSAQAAQELCHLPKIVYLVPTSQQRGNATELVDISDRRTYALPEQPIDCT